MNYLFDSNGFRLVLIELVYIMYTHHVISSPVLHIARVYALGRRTERRCSCAMDGLCRPINFPRDVCGRHTTVRHSIDFPS